MENLTQAIFEGQPSWVVSAAACASGRVMGFSCRASHLTPTGRFNTWIPEDGIEYQAKYIASCYFMDNWSSSAIDRV